MPKQAVPAAGSGLPKDQTRSGPVAALAREVKALSDAHNRLDDQVPQLAGAAGKENVAKMTAIDDRRELIETQASHLLAQSGLGAILQIQLILNEAETMSSWVPAYSKGAKMCADRMKGIERMAYSLVSFIEATTGAHAEDASCDYYMSRDHNPHLRLASALAA